MLRTQLGKFTLSTRPVHTPLLQLTTRGQSKHLNLWSSQHHQSFLAIPQSSRGQRTSDGQVLKYCLPGHGLCGEELQFVVVQTETSESKETSKGLDVEIVERVVTKPEPFDVLQALRGQEEPGFKWLQEVFLATGVKARRSFSTKPERPGWGCRRADCV